MPKITILGGALFSLLVVGCSPRNEFVAPPPPEVTIQQPVQKDVTVYQKFPGRLGASDTVAIRARVRGVLQTIDFKDGQRVQAGDLLYTIDPSEYETSVKAAKAQLQQAEASLKLAEATLKRNQEAFETKAVSEVDVLTAEANAESAKAAVNAATADLEYAKLNLSYTEIRAPMAGRIYSGEFSVGSLVGDGGSTLLTTLVSEAPIYVHFTLDERTMLPYLAAGIRKEQDGTSAIPPVKLELANGTMHEEEGRVDYMDPEVDPSTGTAQARAVFQNDAFKLVSGLYAKILIPQVEKDALLVPDLAVLIDMVGPYVLVVNDANTVEKRYVKKGSLVGADRIIEEGVTATDRVIVEGLQRARPGAEVRMSEVVEDEPQAEQTAE